MGLKHSKPLSTKPMEIDTQHNFTVYLLPIDNEETLNQVYLIVSAQAQKNAVIIFPNLMDFSSSSNGAKKYNAFFIRDGQWIVELGKRKVIFLGSWNFKNAKCMSPNSISNYKNIINTALARANIRQSSLINLHRQLHEYVLPSYSDVNSYVSFAQSSLSIYHLSQSGLKKAKIKKLLLHVIHGEQRQAEDMIKKEPSLLFETGCVIDFSGRKIEGTPLQLALGAEDVKLLGNEEAIAEMIKRYFMQLPNGEIEFALQIRAQFPEGWEEREVQRIQSDSSALKKVLEAISVADEHDPCEAALHEFRVYLQPKEVIKSGKHFNAQLLIDAFRLFNENFLRFGNNWDSPKNILCWQKVIGYIQRFLPASYAQGYCYGLFQIAEWNYPISRSLQFKYDLSTYYPLDLDPRFRLGYEFAADVGIASSRAYNILGTDRLMYIRDLYQKKTSSFQKIISLPENPDNRNRLM